jgi:hypothetical protein
MARLQLNSVSAYVYIQRMSLGPPSLHDYGELLLASRMRRLSEMFYAGVDVVYREQGVSETVGVLGSRNWRRSWGNPTLP